MQKSESWIAPIFSVNLNDQITVWKCSVSECPLLWHGVQQHHCHNSHISNGQNEGAWYTAAATDPRCRVSLLIEKMSKKAVHVCSSEVFILLLNNSYRFLDGKSYRAKGFAKCKSC